MNQLKFIFTIFVFAEILSPINIYANQTQQQASQNRRWLNIINDFAESYCNLFSMGGSINEITASASARVELDNLFKKLADAGMTVDVKYKSSKYKGLLQSDLGNALHDKNSCKMLIWKDLRDRLLPSSVVVNPQKNNESNGCVPVSSTMQTVIIEKNDNDKNCSVFECVQLKADLAQCEREKNKPILAPKVYIFIHQHALNQMGCRSLYMSILAESYPKLRSENYPTGLGLTYEEYQYFIACADNVAIISVAGPDYERASIYATRLYEIAASR